MPLDLKRNVGKNPYQENGGDSVTEPELNQTTEQRTEPLPRKKRIPKPNSSLQTMIQVVSVVLVAWLFVLILDATTVRLKINGNSMEPNITPGTYVLGLRYSIFNAEPEPGDIVVFSVTTEHKDLIKRVIAGPGQTVEMEKGVVFVDGQRLEEPYAASTGEGEGFWVTTDDGYFVLGDNRNYSYDSRDFLFVPDASIIGKAFMVYWPLSEIEFFQNPMDN